MPLEQMDYPASYAALRPVVEHEYFDHRAVPQLEEYLEEQVRKWGGGDDLCCPRTLLCFEVIDEPFARISFQDGEVLPSMYFLGAFIFLLAS